MAMKLAIQKAKKFGIGCVIVKNAGHLGGAGYHAGLAAKEGCIGQVIGWIQIFELDFKGILMLFKV